MVKIKKIISIVLVAALCFTMVPLKVNAKKEETVKEFKEIKTIEDLYGMNNHPKGNYRLMNDIDISAETAKGGSWDTGHGWTPLKEFYGEFDGNGHRIKGMHIYGNPGRYVGLFSEVSGKVYNLGMTDVEIEDLEEDKDYDIGAIAGRLYGSISKCYSSGKLVCPATTNRSNEIACGGIVGEYEGCSWIDSCYNALDIVDSDNECKVSIGGIAGCPFYVDDDYYDDYGIERCYNVGRVSGMAICDSDYYGCSSNYYLSGTAADGDSYATVLTPTQMSIQNMYLGFDLENTWEIDLNSSYKYPQLKENRQQRVEGISIESLPNKLIYAQGEDIDTDGGTVKIIYEGGYSTTILLTKDMLSDYDMTKTGTQNIKVNYGGKTVEFQIKINGIDVTDISISGNNSIIKGDQAKLSVNVVPANATNKEITWSSSDESKAVVDAEGNVKALAAGDVVITATSSNGVSASYNIKIISPCVLLIIDDAEFTLYKGDTKEIKTKLSPIDTTDTVVWSSSNKNIVSVDNAGKITAISPGQAKITAKAGGNPDAKDSCMITVKQKLNSFYIVGVEDKTYTGKSIKQNVRVTDGNVTLKEKEDYKVNYSDNVEVGTATVTVSGLGFYEGTIKKEFKILSKNQKPDIDHSGNNSNNDVNGSDDISNSDTVEKITIAKTSIKYAKNIKGKKIEIQYKKVGKADGYQIRYALKSDMSSSKLKVTAKTKYTITSLKKKKKYYIQVRAYSYDTSNKKVYGKWSSKKSVKVNK